MIQEIYSHKFSIVLMSRGQKSNKSSTEVLHENCSSSVIFALYVGLPKSCVRYETSLFSKNVVQPHWCWIDGCTGGWMDR